MAKRNFFVTGTDTDVGKTVITAGLIEAANQAALTTAAIKPVAAGCEPTDSGLQNADALLLQAAASYPLSYQQVNPVALEPAIAPHIAAAERDKQLSASRLSGFCRGLTLLPVDRLFIEGAGGWRVPLNNRETLADIPKQLNSEVILVVGLRLGCINHALLTVEAIRNDGLSLVGWVGNTLHPDMPRLHENIDTLKRLIPQPCLGVVPWLSDTAPNQVATYISLPK